MILESLSKREKNLVNILLVFVLIALIYWGFGRVLFPKYSVAAQEFEVKKTELEETLALIAMLPDLEEEYQQLKQDADRLKFPMNTEVRNGINYYYIGQHAVNNNVLITKVIPKPLNSDQAVLIIPFEIQVRGYYQDIVNFVKLVEQDMPNTTELLSLRIHPYVEGEETMGTIENQESSNEKESKATEKSEESEAKEDTASAAFTDYQDPVITGNNPEVAGVLNIVTYMVRSPENIQIAQESVLLGRIDAFTPTVNVPKEPVEGEESAVIIADTNSSLPETDAILEDKEDAPIKNAASSSPAKSASVEEPKTETGKEDKSSSPVQEVIVNETGDYSFPVRE